MQVKALFVGVTTPKTSAFKNKDKKWHGLTVPLPPDLWYDGTDSEGALKAHMYATVRYAKIKGVAPTNMEFTEKY